MKMIFFLPEWKVNSIEDEEVVADKGMNFRLRSI